MPSNSTWFRAGAALVLACGSLSSLASAEGPDIRQAMEAILPPPVAAAPADDRCSAGKVWEPTLNQCVKARAGDTRAPNVELTRRAKAAAQEESKRVVSKARAKRAATGYDGTCQTADAAAPNEINLCLTFATGSAVLGTAQKQSLHEAAAAFLDNGNAVVLTIIGHTDITGSREANMELSRQRAQAAVDYLANDCNVPRSRMRAEGVGPDRPLTAAGDKEADRRITLAVGG